MSEQDKRAEEVLETCIEELAAYAHETWSGWMKYQEKTAGQAFWDILPMALAERWIRQANTDYFDLPGAEKKGDQVEARRIVAIMRRPIAAALQEAERRGVEKMLEECRRYWAYMSWGKDSWKAVPLTKIEEAARLLSEQGTESTPVSTAGITPKEEGK